MGLKRSDGLLSSRDRLLYFNIIHVFIYNISSTSIPSKYGKMCRGILRKGSDEDLKYVRGEMEKFIDTFTSEFINTAYETSVLLNGLISMDIRMLREMGFDTSGFLKLEACAVAHPGIKPKKNAIRIINFVEAYLKTHGIEVDRKFSNNHMVKAERVVLSKATSAFVNMDIEVGRSKFIFSLGLRGLILVYFPRALIYIKEEDGSYFIGETSVVGTGGDLKSNLVSLDNEENEVIGIKDMDGLLYLFITKPGSDDIMESVLDIPEAYRYTLEKEDYVIYIHRWLNKSVYIDTYKFEKYELQTEKPIKCSKKNGYVYKGIPDSVFGKAGVKRPDKSLSFIKDDNYILIKDNGNVVVTNKDLKKIKPFKPVDFILNRDDEFNETIKSYGNIKILM